MDIALDVFEKTVISIADEHGFHDLRLQIRSFYGVILAYAGRVNDARVIMGELRAYSATMHPFERDGINNQIELIEAISRGEIKLIQFGEKKPGMGLLEYFTK